MVYNGSLRTPLDLHCPIALIPLQIRNLHPYYLFPFSSYHASSHPRRDPSDPSPARAIRQPPHCFVLPT